jgi:hypothetical protein
MNFPSTFDADGLVMAFLLQFGLTACCETIDVRFYILISARMSDRPRP